MKPIVIGITPTALTLEGPNGHGGFCGMPYSQSIHLAGGVAVVLPLTNDLAMLKPFFSICNGFLLSGGADLAESSGAYGRNLTPTEQQTMSNTDTIRDEMEIFLAAEIVRRDIPVLGICRGLQVMNTALGGTLLPHIPNHRDVTHGITWTHERQLCTTRRVNSRHHQAIDCLAPSLEVAARSDDGIIEAAVMPGMRFFAGVQFHPEQMPRARDLFKQLVSAAEARRTL
ncbi:MAG: type 1 glutamine amidotransferase [bacterium]